MNLEHLIPVIVAVFVTGVTITASLIAVIFRWLKRTVERNEEKLDKDIGNLRDKFHDNVRSNTHRVNELRQQITTLQQMILQDVIERQKMATVDTENYSRLLEKYDKLREFVEADKSRQSEI